MIKNLASISTLKDFNDLVNGMTISVGWREARKCVKGSDKYTLNELVNKLWILQSEYQQNPKMVHALVGTLQKLDRKGEKLRLRKSLLLQMVVKCRQFFGNLFSGLPKNKKDLLSDIIQKAPIKKEEVEPLKTKEIILPLSSLSTSENQEDKKDIHQLLNKEENTKALQETAVKEKDSEPLSMPQEQPKWQLKKVSSLEMVEGKIKMGQGEYIVYHRLANGTQQEVSREIYSKVYEILNQETPLAIINHNVESDVMENCVNRYKRIKEKIKQIDPTIKLVFVPRTLCELIFIRACIQEDIVNKKLCEYGSIVNIERRMADLETQSLEECGIVSDKKCWHLCCFTKECDNNHQAVKEVGYLLNQEMIKVLNPKKEEFSYQNYQEHAEQLISFLKEHHESKKKLEVEFRIHYVNPTLSFYTESSKGGSRFPLGVRDEEDAQMIRDALTLDCSVLAQKAFILYRGAHFKIDSCIGKSLSFGSSLFAGLINDQTATAFHYMRKKDHDAYAISVPFDQLKQSPFYIPSGNTFANFYGREELFHPRTRVWKGCDLKNVSGIEFTATKETRERYVSSFTPQELQEQFALYKRQAIVLKGNCQPKT